MGRPKEDPADKAARLRERRMTELDRARSGEMNAASLTSDMRSVYNMKSLPGISFAPGVARSPSIFTPRSGSMKAAAK